MSTPPDIASNPLRTRDDLQRLARALVDPVLPHFSPGKARVTVGANRAGYGDPSSLLEGVSRPLWGLVPLAAGGGDFAHWALWREALAHGCDPDHPEFWGWAGDFDQRSVEQAAFGLALALAPREMWDPLSLRERTLVSAWLRHINDVKLVQSNWLYFRVLVNLGLRRVGEPWSAAHVRQDLDSLDAFYLGGGWYSDGKDSSHHRDGRLGDYYVPMAFHFYGLLYARLANDDDPVRASRHVERARLFARDFVHWFAADGSALPFGRSLTYRFAQGAFWGAAAFAGAEVLPWGVMKGIYLRHLRWWMSQPIFTNDGLLSIGYAYPNLLMAESYNSSASPYWALKALLPLALAENHPFWRAEEAPLPPRRRLHTVPGANLILQTSPGHSDVTALNPGQPVLDWPRCAPHKYSKFSYSTRFGFSVGTGLPNAGDGGLDSVLSVSEDGRLYRIREHCTDASVRDGVAFARWRPWADVEIASWIVGLEDAHIRIHRVTTGRTLWTLEGGFAAPYVEKARVETEVDATRAARVTSPAGTSRLRALLDGPQAATQETGANCHLLASLAIMPVLRRELAPGVHWLAALAAGAGPDVPPPAAWGEEWSVQPATGGAALELRRGADTWWSTDGDHAGVSAPARLAWLASSTTG